MNPLLEQIRERLNLHAPCYGSEDIQSLCELLWDIYTSYNPIDSQEIRDCYFALDPIFNSLPFSDSNSLFSTVCQLCEHYERAAFLEGLRVGFQLVTELTPDREM